MSNPNHDEQGRFASGDSVSITKGEHAGKTGKVVHSSGGKTLVDTGNMSHIVVKTAHLRGKNTAPTPRAARIMKLHQMIKSGELHPIALRNAEMEHTLLSTQGDLKTARAQLKKAFPNRSANHTVDLGVDHDSKIKAIKGKLTRAKAKLAKLTGDHDLVTINPGHAHLEEKNSIGRGEKIPLPGTSKSQPVTGKYRTRARKLMKLNPNLFKNH